jgi:phage recombination protein Bet
MIKKDEALATTSEAGLAIKGEHSALAIMAERYRVEPQKLLGTLKGTVFKGATNEELLTLVVVANEYRLNPLTKEIYAFPSQHGGGITPVVSVDGWISILNRRPDFDGISFEYDDDPEGRPVSCTATVHVKDRSHPIVVTEFFAECSRKTQPWQQFPRRMMRHKALIQSARIAFGFAGIYDDDEARDISNGAALAPAKPVFEDDPGEEYVPAEELPPGRPDGDDDDDVPMLFEEDVQLTPAEQVRGGMGPDS